MHIIEALNKNGITYTLIASDIAATFCPFCEKIPQGKPRATLNIDLRVETGHCSTCKRNADWEEIEEALGIIKSEQQPEEKKIKALVKTKPRIELEPLPPAERIKKLGKPEKETSFEEWQDIIRSNFPDLLFAAEMGLAILSQIIIKDITNPFALVLVDVPSAGKTIAINFFADIKELAYATDKFTPASFVSNAANVKKEELRNIDLLPRLQYKMFIIRDLATLFSKRDDDLRECLGILTRVLDGEGLNTDSGVHGQREYNGEYLFMILAASTPIPGKVWKVMGGLGSRLFFLSLNAKDKSENELANQLKKTAYKEKEKVCRNATTDFLKTLWNKYPDGIVWDKEKDQDEILVIISRCAQLLAKLRGVIHVWSEGGPLDEFEPKAYNYTVPVIEKPDRINQLFYNISRGHALVNGRNQINKDDLRLVLELMIDSAPTILAKLFRKLLEHNGVMTTTEIEREMNCPKQKVLNEMEKLKLLGVCYLSRESHGKVGEPEKEIHLVDEFQWFLSDECRKIRGLEVEPKQSTMSDLIIDNQ